MWIHLEFAPFATESEKIVMPSLEERRKILQHHLVEDNVEGDIYYIVSVNWLMTWNDFVVKRQIGIPAKPPGPVDNFPVLTNDLKALRRGLREKYHYRVISSESWDFLTKWFGRMPDQVPITRKGICSGNVYSSLSLTQLKCYKNFNKETEIQIKVLFNDLIETVHYRLKILYNVPKGVGSRLWMPFCEDKYDLLKFDLSVKDSGLGECGCVVLDVEVNGSWQNIKRTLVDVTSQTHTQSYTPRNNSGHFKSSRQATFIKLPGVCGLNNLGSTCFMNSVIQCLSNTPPLTEYFLNNRHLEELNTSNPLGMEGEIARAYGMLLHTMWSGEFSNTSPLSLKIQISKFNSQFHRHQHDAQEVLTFLLDGMHEDLNRINSKPYVLNNDVPGQKDYVIAKNYWRNYRKINDSIVVDTFHGLLKSKVVCPHCDMFSVKFDPFSILSLPFPLRNDRLVKIRFIPYDPAKRECMYSVAVPRRGLFKDLCSEVGTKTNSNPLTLIPAVINNSHFHKFYSQEDHLEGIIEKDSIFIYEMTEKVYDPDFMILPICFWETTQQTEKFSQEHLFGVPFLVLLQKDDLNLNQVCKEIFYHIRRHCNLPESLWCDYNSEVFANFREVYIPNLYLFENGLQKNPLKLYFDENGDCMDDLTDLLEVDEPGREFGRKILIVQFSMDEKREYYCEQSVYYGPDFNFSALYSNKKEKLIIYDCLDLFITFEKLGEDNAWLCPQCKKQQRATKQLDLWKLPKVLIIHLKRFSFFQAGDKIETLVEYPINDLHLSNYVTNPDQQNISYDLIGVINHYGTLNGGHYTAYCKNKATNSWYLFNDDSVKPIDVENLVSTNAYLLFYNRNDTFTHHSEVKFDIVD